MNQLIRAELRRLLTTPLWKWGPVAAIVCGGALVALVVSIGLENLEPAAPGIETVEGTRTVLSLVSLTAIVPALFGATAVTSEYRHRTITLTFLFAPRRYTVLAAKLLAYAVVGAAYGLMASGSAAAGLYGAAALTGVEVGAPPAAVAELLLYLILIMTAYTVLGVGVGALLRNQTVTLAVFGLYLYSIEHSLALIPGLNAIYPYLPGGATVALTNFALLADAAEEVAGAPTPLLPPLLGALVLTAYALAAAAVAILVPMRRDVT